MERPAGKRRKVVVGTALVGTAVVAGAIAWLAFDYTSTPRLGTTTPGDNGWVRQSQPQITMHVDNAANLENYSVDLDGVNVTSQVQRSGDQLTVAGVPLDDGQHTVTLSAESGGLFGGHIARTFTFNVDTQAPKLALSQRLDGYVKSNNLSVTGTSEPGVRVKIAAGSTTVDATAGEDGSFTTALNLPDGSYPVSITAIDPAGNTSVHRGEIKVDATAPAVTLRASSKPHHTRPMIAGTVNDTSAVTTKTTLDGLPFKLGTKPSAPLAQGAHVLRVQATDAAGNVTVKHARILVNTSEKLGTNALIAGAVGKDVKQLQRSLVTDELLKKGGVTGFYDRRTIAAVKSFQVSRALPVTGQADLTTIGALTTRIVIDESSHSLTLTRPGQAPVVFGVAVGQSAYPTPTGSFHIISKVVDPTWTPPDSPWAQGELPVPPGPDNPLGTRWMGLNVSGVGIHGTNDPSSIGYSVSHGCIRMQIPDAERLFTMVSLGMSVYIHA
jgi:lipoprotein-anchoring transpeptidase ErfK/SrfK